MNIALRIHMKDNTGQKVSVITINLVGQSVLAIYHCTGTSHNYCVVTSGILLLFTDLHFDDVSKTYVISIL